MPWSHRLRRQSRSAAVAAVVPAPNRWSIRKVRATGTSPSVPCPSDGPGERAALGAGYGGTTMSASQTSSYESSDVPTLLVKIFGKDRPGITAGLFDTLPADSVDVVDIEQPGTRGRLVLGA